MLRVCAEVTAAKQPVNFSLYPAPTLCSKLVVEDEFGNQYDDWFVPSEKELLKMYENLHSREDENNEVFEPVGSFSTDFRILGYLSSSEWPSHVASPDYGEHPLKPCMFEAFDFGGMQDGFSNPRPARSTSAEQSDRGWVRAARRF